MPRFVLQVTGPLARSWDPAVGGQLMLASSGLIVVLTLPLLDPTVWRSASMMVLLVTVAACGGSMLVPWRRLPRACTLAFPIFVWAAVAVLGSTTDGIGGNYSGLYALWFAYLGLTQPPGASITLLPVAIGSYLVSWGGPSWPLVARLLIAVAVWLILGELLAALIQRQRSLTDEMRVLAHVDTLTKLGNRRDLDLRLADAAPGDTLVLCDLDHFKQLNDTLGHAAGDAVLTDFGLVIRATLRKLDYAARYGGEEFALLLPATATAQAAILLTRLRKRWAILHPEITFSAGVATCRDGQPVAATLAEADRAMYAAKAAGRNRDHSGAGPLATAVPVLSSVEVADELVW
ncbi:MAG TPA: GGDEF domain-containing protein [Jatrophihabitans sp.]|nr:GGDEF domain-containing protein [Jatrophihabitans sp.]